MPNSQRDRKEIRHLVGIGRERLPLAGSPVRATRSPAGSAPVSDGILCYTFSNKMTYNATRSVPRALEVGAARCVAAGRGGRALGSLLATRQPDEASDPAQISPRVVHPEIDAIPQSARRSLISAPWWSCRRALIPSHRPQVSCGIRCEATPSRAVEQNTCAPQALSPTGSASGCDNAAATGKILQDRI